MEYSILGVMFWIVRIGCGYGSNQTSVWLTTADHMFSYVVLFIRLSLPIYPGLVSHLQLHALLITLVYLLFSNLHDLVIVPEKQKTLPTEFVYLGTKKLDQGKEIGHTKYIGIDNLNT